MLEQKSPPSESGLAEVKKGKVGTVVCIPAFNEEASIARVVMGARRHADAVMVCDDGSTDMTGEIAEALGARVLRNERRMGKGAALRRLVEEARKLRPEVVVTMDADLQHDPAEIPTLVEPIVRGEADVVIGARDMGEAPQSRVIGNRLLDAVTNAKTGERIRDTQSGFRAYRLEALEKVQFTESGMSVESQTLIDAVKAGLSIDEVRVSTTYTGVRRAKRNPAGHLLEVVDYIVSRTVVESPLLYIGLPGLVSVVLGVAAGFRVVEIFMSTRQIAVGTGLISVTLIIIGSVMLATSLILKLLKAQGKPGA